MIKDLIIKLWKSITQGLFESSHATELAAANARIAELEGQVTSLQTAAAATDKLLTESRLKETAAQNDLQSLQVAYRSLQAGYGVLEAKLQGIDADVKTVADKPIDSVFSDLGGGSPKP